MQAQFLHRMMYRVCDSRPRFRNVDRPSSDIRVANGSRSIVIHCGWHLAARDSRLHCCRINLVRCGRIAHGKEIAQPYAVYASYHERCACTG